jgi:hypothetical protein
MTFKIECRHWIGKHTPTDAKWEFITIGDGNDDGVMTLAHSQEVMQRLLRHPQILQVRAHVQADKAPAQPPQIGQVVDGQA